MVKTAELSSSLIATKGNAVPTQVTAEPAQLALVATPVKAPTRPRPATKAPAPAVEPENVSGQAYFKAMTLKLDKKRFMDLKTAGLARQKTSQVILTEALDLWLEKNAG